MTIRQGRTSLGDLRLYFWKFIPSRCRARKRVHSLTNGRNLRRISSSGSHVSTLCMGRSQPRNWKPLEGTKLSARRQMHQKSIGLHPFNWVSLRRSTCFGSTTERRSRRISCRKAVAGRCRLYPMSTDATATQFNRMSADTSCTLEELICWHYLSNRFSTTDRPYQTETVRVMFTPVDTTRAVRPEWPSVQSRLEIYRWKTFFADSASCIII